jgi:hypothetical protein
MELLDRYLEAVRKYLPWRRQDDILSELKANLEAQLEDREAELGRPLTQGKSEDWLRELGAPIQVAARYQSQQYLIGPRLFPVYMVVLRTALLWVLAVSIIIWTVQLFVSGMQFLPTVSATAGLPWSLAITAGIITALFAAVEFLSIHYPERFPELARKAGEWSPTDLPPLPDSNRRQGKPRSLAAAVAGLMSALFLAWWMLVPRYPFLMLGPGAALWQHSPFDYAPVIVQFYWWVAAINLLQVVWRAVDLVRGAWQRHSVLEHQAMTALGLIPLILLATAPGYAYIRLKQPQLGGAAASQLNSINQLFHAAFSIALAVMVLELAWEILRHFRQRGRRLA